VDPAVELIPELLDPSAGVFSGVDPGVAAALLPLGLGFGFIPGAVALLPDSEPVPGVVEDAPLGLVVFEPGSPELLAPPVLAPPPMPPVAPELLPPAAPPVPPQAWAIKVPVYGSVLLPKRETP
jgi:hypothetical protein